MSTSACSVPVLRLHFAFYSRLLIHRLHFLLEPWNLFQAVPICSEERIRLTWKEFCRDGVGIRRKVWVDVLPANIIILGDLEQTSKSTLTQQSVAIVQPLRTAHEGCEEVVHLRLIAVLPDNLAGLSVHLDGARVGDGLAGSKSSVVKDENVAIFELRRVVLLREDGGVEGPDDGAGGAGDDDDGGDGAEGCEDVFAIAQGQDGVDERVVLASVVRLEGVLVSREAVRDFPLPGEVPVGVDFVDGVGVGDAVDLGAGNTALDFLRVLEG